MDEYRVYFLDDRDRRVSCFEFTCDTDEAAQRAAQQFGPRHRQELWCGSRYIACPSSEPPPPYPSRTRADFG